MKSRIRKSVEAIWFSLPIRLLMRQLHSHKFLLLFWIFLLGVLSGTVGESFGGAYLFLEPEYLGQENFWSTFLIGSALGGFLFAYAITFYINESYRFHFVALCKHPFFLMAYNNLLLPGLLLTIYFWQFLSYHISLAGGFTWHVFELFSGLIVGLLAVFLVTASYFFAEHSLLDRFGEKLEDELGRSKPRRSRWIILGKARESLRSRQRADSYLEFPFRIQQVNRPDQARLSELIDNLTKHHGKLLLLQVFTFSLIGVLGLMEDSPFFQIPAGASFLLILSLFMMIIGAVTFWFRKTGVLTLAIVIGLVYMYGKVDWFRERNYAAGLNYESAPAVYDRGHIQGLQTPENFEADRQATLEILENWKARYQEKYGPGALPNAVIVTASGGGLRSAFWTFRTMQYLDSLSQGRLTDEMRLMSGASGGMFGLAYFRELAYRRSMGVPLDLQHERYSDNMSKDLLNRIFFRMFSDILLPNRQVEVDGQRFDREAGYSFDQQLSRNLPEIAGRRIGDYAQPEADGIIPQLILAPTIINQSRKLFIASQPVSYLTRPSQITEVYQSRSPGIEFRRFFADHRPDSLHLTSALRMNATFPYILPVVSLPSEPRMQVMDAGALDNFGTQTAVKYLFEFRDWFAENTAGVILVQIRDNDREDPIMEGGNHGLVDQLFTPLGGGYKSMFEAKDLGNDFLLEYVREWYDGPLQVLSFEYPKDQFDQPASLSWHLTRREKRSIEYSLQQLSEKEDLIALQRMYQPRMLAIGQE